MELNAETIKSGLECCTSPDGDGTCLLCPYGDINLCTQSLMAHALALITSQEQRIKEQCKTAKKLRKQLKKANRGVRIFANRTKQLTEAKERLYQSCTNLERDTRADTVRKMQERLEKSIVPYTNISKGEKLVAFIWCLEIIERIAKEMSEDER